VSVLAVVSYLKRAYRGNSRADMLDEIEQRILCRELRKARSELSDLSAQAGELIAEMRRLIDESKASEADR